MTIAYALVMTRIAVLASGGVDSSVALARLAEAGAHALTAFYLKIWLGIIIIYISPFGQNSYVSQLPQPKGKQIYKMAGIVYQSLRIPHHTFTGQLNPPALDHCSNFEHRWISPSNKVNQNREIVFATDPKHLLSLLQVIGGRFFHQHQSRFRNRNNFL